MKILFLSQLLPYPLDSGVKFRMYYTLRQLAKHHEVTLLCFIRKDNTSDQIAHLRKYCQAVHTGIISRSTMLNARYLLQSLVTGKSFIISRDTVPAMQAKLDNLVQSAQLSGAPFDAIHCDQLWMAQYVIHSNFLTFQPANIRTVLDQHNAVFQIPKRMAEYANNPLKRMFLEKESHKLANYEAQTCQQFDHVIWVTKEDYQAVQSQQRLHSRQTTNRISIINNQQSKINNSIIPICLDASETIPVRRIEQPKQILHLGTMYWPPNIDGVLWFAREIFPLVRQQIPGSEFTVVGKNPPASIRNLASQPGIRVMGYVSDATPYLEKSAAFIVPVRAGGGMRVKIIDAWLRGVPVVSTTVGAEGIDTCPGENILIADDASSFAQAIVQLVCDPAFSKQLVMNGRRWAESKYDWRRVYPALDEIYDHL